ncbi:hypothetical protein [Crocinitomix catalasitica]|uniref:hypothetical protein n=1 Tax=Crocinitomix catalasitica TaxID=184607 RepID=UPI0004846443|nr:hypothetical protein [Crocinitomix catalasitica]
MIKKTIVFGAIIAVISSCYKDNEEDLYKDSECDVTDVSFSEDIMPIINASCATVGCHIAGGSGNGEFINYAQVFTKVENGSLMNRVVTLRDMPPSGSLTDCQIEHFEQWINDGALDN